MVLPDTSIWITFLRPGGAGLTVELSGMLDRVEVLVCGPVLAELIAGAQPTDREVLATTLAALPWADLERSDWRAVGEAAASLRERGQQIPLTDIEIGIAARAADAELWTADRDFERLAAILDGLRLRLEPAATERP